MTKTDSVTPEIISNKYLYKALMDIFLGLRQWRVWLMLGWQDIRLRYRRSTLGPLWITLSMAIMIYTLGFLYSHLWRASIHEFMYYYGAGMLSFTLIMGITTESSNIFSESKSYILQIELPFTIYVMRLLTRNYIIFLHNCLAIVPLLIYYHAQLTWATALLPLILLLIFLPAFVFSMLIAIIGLRYRDIGQLINSVMNLFFFVTPIMWMPKNLPGKYHFIIAYNPFAQFVELIRNPLMGKLPSEHAVLFVLGMFVFGLVCLLWCMTKVRHRLVFWL